MGSVPVSQGNQARPGEAQAPRRKRIGELLINEGFIEPQHVKQALEIQKKQGGKLAQILIDLGHLDVEAFAKFITGQRGIPAIELRRYQIQEKLCELIPKEFTEEYEVFPIDKLGKLLTVGMVYPLDTNAIEQLVQLTGLKVKAVLCSAEDIRYAIQQYYRDDDTRDTLQEFSEEKMASTRRLNEVAQLLRKLEQLPTLPQTVERVREMVHDSSKSIRDVADVVAMDPPIAAKLLRLANSAAYGLKNRVDDVVHATTLLGMKETYMVVMSLGVINILERSDGFDYKRFWRTSLFGAVAARRLADRLAAVKMAGVSTAGLLHEIGRFALWEVVSDRYNELDHNLFGDKFIAAENQAFGIAHPEAGYILATHWGLPADIADAIRFHHAPNLARENQSIVNLVALAAALTEAESANPADAAELKVLVGGRAARVGVDSDSLYALYQDTQKEVAESTAV